MSTSDVPRWLKLHGARTLTVDRKTGDKRTIRVPNAAVCVTGTIQPDILREALTPGYFQSGLVARLLLVRPPRTPRRWTDAEVDEKTTKDYADVLGKLWALGPAKGEDDRARPVLVKMTPGAHALWVKFFDAHGLRQDDAEEDVLAAFAKLEAYCARFGRRAVGLTSSAWAGCSGR